MSKNDEGNTYILLNKHPDEDEAEYVGFAEERFKTDEEAIKQYQGRFKNTGDSVVVKVIARTKNLLTKVEED